MSDLIPVVTTSVAGAGIFYWGNSALIRWQFRQDKTSDNPLRRAYASQVAAVAQTSVMLLTGMIFTVNIVNVAADLPWWLAWTLIPPFLVPVMLWERRRLRQIRG